MILKCTVLLFQVCRTRQAEREKVEAGEPRDDLSGLNNR